MEWNELVTKHIFDLFTAENENRDNPRALLKKAIENGPSFGARKLARVLLEIKDEERGALAELIMEACGGNRAKRSHILRFLEDNLEKVPEIEHSQILAKAFDLDFDEIYIFLFKNLRSNPTEKTWKQIWPKILENALVLDEVLKRYAIYKPRPPVSLDLFIDGTKIRKPMLIVTQHLLKDDKKVVDNLWQIYLKQAPQLSVDDREDMLGLIAGGDLVYLTSSPGFIKSLADFLGDPSNLELRSFSTLWDNLSYLPEGALERVSKDEGYQQLIKKIFAALIDPDLDDSRRALSLFIRRAPWDVQWAIEFRERVLTLARETKNSDVRVHLGELEKIFNPPVDHNAIERQKLAEERTKLNEREQVVQMRETENQNLKTTGDIAIKQTQLAALQASFQIKTYEIEISKLSPVEKAEAHRLAALEFQKRIEAIINF
jgi:hypothetical protein